MPPGSADKNGGRKIKPPPEDIPPSCWFCSLTGSIARSGTLRSQLITDTVAFAVACELSLVEIRSKRSIQI